ncbi:MAG: ATP-binding protein [Nocardioidaceae bacterium]
MVGSQIAWSHTTTLDPTPVSAAQARGFVSRHLIDHRLLRMVDPVRLVASELATNALTHARTAFKVTLSGQDDTVLLTVSDYSASLPAAHDAQVMDSRGRGLSIVAVVSTEWGWREDKAGAKTVWASFTTA